MLHIDLTLEEHDLLMEMLESCFTDLRGEIMDTDRRAYKESLKQREMLLKKIIAAVQSAKELAAA